MSIKSEPILAVKKTRQKLFSITEIGIMEDAADYPFSSAEPNLEGIDFEEAGYPRPLTESETFVVFGSEVRTLEREVKWDGEWTITGMGSQKDKCGEHLGLYSDGRYFTRTRRSCHRQECPICSWKWEAKAGDNASQYLQFVHTIDSVELRHASFNPVLACYEKEGKIVAAVDSEGHPIPFAEVGDMAAFKLEKMRAFMEKYHDSSIGPLGGAYILHPGRETARGNGQYYYSPHVHLITNFTFRQSDVQAMKADCLEGGFTLTIFYNKNTSSYSIDCQNHVDEDGRETNDLTAKLIYNLSHALVKKGTVQNHAGVTYFGSFRPALHDFVKVKRKVLVRSKAGRGMVKVKTQVPEEVGNEVIVRPIRVKGRVVPELTKMGAYKWLKLWRYKYLFEPCQVRKGDRIVSASKAYRDCYEIAQRERERWKTFDT